MIHHCHRPLDVIIIYLFQQSIWHTPDDIAQVTVVAVFVTGVNTVKTFADVNLLWFSEHDVCL
jgi:hypothetical protein